MTIRALEIEGYRGFATRQRITFALPNGNRGSGLTVVVGPNNSGKSTIIEALRVFGNTSLPSFTEGKRNKKANDQVVLSIEYGKDKQSTLRTVAAGGSETEFDSPPTIFAARSSLCPRAATSGRILTEAPTTESNTP